MNEEHTWENHQNCERSCCPICEGGLSVCTVCGLAEGSLTTHCPGLNVFHDKSNDIYNGKIDFKDGAWVNQCSPYSPEFWNSNNQTLNGVKYK